MHDKIRPVSGERHLEHIITIIRGVLPANESSLSLCTVCRGAQGFTQGTLPPCLWLWVRMLREVYTTAQTPAWYCRLPVRRIGSRQGRLWAQ